MRRRNRRSAICAAIAALLCTPTGIVACTRGDPAPPAPQRQPVLETVVAVDRVVPQDPDGVFSALPVSGPVRVRVQADWSTNIRVSVDGVDIPERTGQGDNEAWYDANANIMPSMSRKLFWDFAVSLPPGKRGGAPAAPPVRLQVRDETFLQNPPPIEQRPPLNVDLIHAQRPGRFQLPSNFYNEATGDNTKQDGRAKSQVITKGIVLAGWLVSAPGRNDAGEDIRANESEDYHYDIWLDQDFLDRNYGTPRPLQPVASAIVKGARSRLIDLRPGVDIPLLTNGKVTAASFSWPGNGVFTVELNAWHIADRGRPPAEWAGTDPGDPDKSGNAWPFVPRRPLGAASAEPDMAADDYVIISGTLWQDTAHLDEQDDVSRYRRCWDGFLPGHGGWLEIHPVDSIRRVDPPSPRKHAETVGVCDPQRRDAEVVLTPAVNRGVTVTPDMVLRCQRLIDDRFTGHKSFQAGENLTQDTPPKLHVRLITLIGTKAKADYILWYEKPDSSRPSPDPGNPCTVA